MSNQRSTPARPPPALKKQASSGASSSQKTNQSTLLGFLSRTPSGKAKAPAGGVDERRRRLGDDDVVLNSDGVGSEDGGDVGSAGVGGGGGDTLSSSQAKDDSPPQAASRKSIATAPQKAQKQEVPLVWSSSPARKAKKVVNYAESDDDEDADEMIVSRRPKPRRGGRAGPGNRSDEDDEDAFVAGLDGAADVSDEDAMSDFIVPSDSDEGTSRKRKRQSRPTQSRKRSSPAGPRESPRIVEDASDDDATLPTQSTARQWQFDPANPRAGPLQERSANTSKPPTSQGKKIKEKACRSEPEKRYEWLANLRDMDGNPIGHAEYDPRTVYIPPMAWNRFSPFEKQYWEIKQKLYDTIVFFKKGKFYELYENDATVGHQLFDLKLTDRVNMRMVGVPEMSLDHWANQFVAKGFKIARVDQCESALGKEMRERDGQSAKDSKADKIIRRELSCVLTGGTLVEGSMLQDDAATYCVAIKECATAEDEPLFGVSFVDTATGQFVLSDFVDDAELTKFETLMAQIRPRELLVEKSCLSTKALRILKSNTSPMTLWNHLKPGREFWNADMTCRELDCSGYFDTIEGAAQWPEVLAAARAKDVAMSSFGALVHYLRTLKLDRDLLSQANIVAFDPIQKGTTLVLDGQTLINLEVFNNTLDGGVEGTLFSIVNRCVTPFGKRLIRQWLCHPLADGPRINERLDAVELFMRDRRLSDQFTASLTRMPDLERLVSRIHAGSCRPDDFVRVLEGFEQIEYTMSLFPKPDSAPAALTRLLSSMPDLAKPLQWWKTAFDRTKAREYKLLVPETGIEQDFDASQALIESIEADFQQLLSQCQKDYSRKAEYKNLGKEIYQIQVPASTKVPSSWKMMSSASGFKRYYFPELNALIRKLQEAQERHGQIVKNVASKFFARFDADSATWQQAIRVVAQLDCLISLASASQAMGSPSCRPVFVEDERTVVDFEELRHPCILPNVTDFIPNDIRLGGDSPKMNLLTGANAAGKSTVLRMTCTAVILAQLGCYVPCKSARLSPIDRIMSRLGANDNIYAAQSTFFVELAETKKILAEATPRSLVILDELGRGTSSYDGVAVAQAVLHHVATHTGCVGYFATHYHSLAAEFAGHPEIRARRMRIAVDAPRRRITFLYRLEDGVAEGSFGMHCAAMCGIPDAVVSAAERAARDREHTARLRESLELARAAAAATTYLPLGLLSDVAWALRAGEARAGGQVEEQQQQQQALQGVSRESLAILRSALKGLELDGGATMA